MAKHFYFLVFFFASLSKVCAQKNELNISAGPIISFPVNLSGMPVAWKTGAGLELLGQYFISDKSALLMQTGFVTYKAKRPQLSYLSSYTVFSLRGGYKYQFKPYGFFLNGLAGIDMDMDDNFSTISFALGGGHRFRIREKYLVDVGIDLIDGDADSRINFKVLFCFLRKAKGNQQY